MACCVSCPSSVRLNIQTGVREHFVKQDFLCALCAHKRSFFIRRKFLRKSYESVYKKEPLEIA